MRAVNILDLRDTYEVGGPGKTILETFRVIDGSRFRVHLAVFATRHETEETPFAAAARQYGLHPHVLRGFNQYDLRQVSRLATLLETLRIDIVHSHEVKSDVLGYLASKMRPVRTVATLHGWIANDTKQWLLGGLDRRLVRRFDRVIAVSTAMRDELLDAGVAPDRLRLLHNGIVIEKYRRLGERGFLAGLLGRPLHSPVITSIGRLSKEKGHVDLVEALAILRQHGHVVTGVLVGEGPERSNIVERIAAFGLQDSVHLTGHVPSPARVLEETDLAVLPSHTEGLPNAALEALAMEVPVLATRVGGTPEIIADGDTGRLVDPRAPRDLAAAITDFLAHPRAWRTMAERGRRLVQQRFDFTVRTRNLEHIYAELSAGSCG